MSAGSAARQFMATSFPLSGCEKQQRKLYEKSREGDRHR